MNWFKKRRLAKFVKQIYAMDVEDLRELLAKHPKNIHISYDPKKAPIRPPKEKKREVGIISRVQDC